MHDKRYKSALSLAGCSLTSDHTAPFVGILSKMRFTWSIFVAAAAAVPTSHLSHVVHEKRAERTNWIKYDELHDDIKLPVRIGLTQKNLHKLDEYLQEV